MYKTTASHEPWNRGAAARFSRHIMLRSLIAFLVIFGFALHGIATAASMDHACNGGEFHADAYPDAS